MTIHKTAYNTTACQGAVIKKTIDALDAAIIDGAVMVEEKVLFLVKGGSPRADAIPAFAHPMLIKNPFEHSTCNVASDVRAFGKFDPAQHEFRIRNIIEYKLAIVRAKLNHIWVNESPTLLRDISQLPITIFASWVSEAVAKRYALDPREQLNLAILAAIFYASNFSDNIEPNEAEKLRITSAVSRALKASAEEVLEIVDKVPHITDSVHFCKVAEEVTGSVRLADLNIGVLFHILGGTWFSTNGKEMVAVALEHPPTWLAILLSALMERSFKDSAITKLTERSSNRDIGKGYMRSLLNLLEVESD